jgi:hypothetical protein
MALTIPANGTNAQGSSTCNLGTLPAANWTVTFYHIGGTTAGCAGSSTAMGTDTISASGAQSWSLTSTTFAPGDCLGAKAQSSVDSLAAYLQCSIVVVK